MFLQIFSTQHIREPTGASTSPMHHDLCWSSTAESAFDFLSTNGQNTTLSQKRLNSLNELELTQHVRVVSILIINQQQIKANITIVTNQPEFSATNLSSLNACVWGPGEHKYDYSVKLEIKLWSGCVRNCVQIEPRLCFAKGGITRMGNH